MFKRIPIAIALACLIWAGVGPARAEDLRASRALAGQIGMGLGHLQSWELNFPAFFPWVDFRAGYQVNEWLLGRLDLGVGVSQVMNSKNTYFEGGTLMIGKLDINFIWTPQISEDLFFHLGGGAGWWFLGLWGDNLGGSSTSAGSRIEYLENTVPAFGALLGLEWAVSRKWALTFEARYTFANGDLGGDSYNFGGLAIYIGFLYRLKAYDVEVP